MLGREAKSIPYSSPKDPRFVVSFTTMTASLVFIFLEEDLTTGLPLREQDVVLALVLEKLLLQRSAASERKCQEQGPQASAYKGSNAPVRGKLHPDLARLGTIWCLLVSAKLAQTPGVCCSPALSLSGFKSPPAFLFLWAHLPSLGTSTSKLCREKIHC